jgi:hypothetical protein
MASLLDFIRTKFRDEEFDKDSVMPLKIELNAHLVRELCSNLGDAAIWA